MNFLTVINTDQLASNQTDGWKTYEDTEYGFRIQYPVEWKIADPSSSDNLTASINSLSGKKEILKVGVPEDNPSFMGGSTYKTSVVVLVGNVSRSLDPNTLELTSPTAEDYAGEVTSELVSPITQPFTKDTFANFPDIVKDEAVTISGEPAWQVNYITNYGGYQIGYDSKIFVIKDDKVFEITFSTDPVLVPQMRPIGEKVLQSFQFINNTDS